jgi:DNA polymerase alpha subunit A
MKKKYVAMKLKNFDEVLVKKVEPVFEIEYKGVDLVKRDGCEVSRRASKAVLNILMQNKGSVEFAVSEIYKYVEELEKYLTTIQPKKDYKEFLLAKTLNKHPSEYKNGSDRMPHIKVARDRINAGEKA